MAPKGSRNESANRELKKAREAYETLVSTKGKKIIDEIEAEVNEEHERLDMQSIEEEIEWISDPGTPTTRATQFVRTQSETWQMKIMLAKALAK